MKSFLNWVCICLTIGFLFGCVRYLPATEEQTRLSSETADFYLKAVEALSQQSTDSAKNFAALSLDRAIKLEQTGIQNKELYYQLGTLYQFLENNGEAILYYKKSLKKGFSLDAYVALRRIKGAQSFKVGIDKDSFLFLIKYRMVKNEQFVLSLILITVLLYILLLLYEFLKRKKSAPLRLLFLSIAIIFLTISILSIAYQKWEQEGVILKEVTPKTGNSYAFPDFSENKTAVGLEVRIVKEEGDWSYVEDSEGYRFWIPTFAFKKV